uniref:Uncharacterized protein n=1 Tax=Fagus sylvatica TaxID=28930 RepID=A0A2N9IJ90_FAGSY
MIGRFQAAYTTPLLSHFPFHLSFIRSGLVWVGLAEGFGWLELPSNLFSFVGTPLPF